MRTAKINLDGQERILCFSGRVLQAINDKYQSMEGYFDALRSQDQWDAFDAAIWGLAQMMEAGHKYAKHEGIDAAPPLTEDDLLDFCDLSDLSSFGGKIMETVSAGTEREVSAEPPKNVSTTPEIETVAR